jgi:hypothetical protein
MVLLHLLSGRSEVGELGLEALDFFFDLLSGGNLLLLLFGRFEIFGLSFVTEIIDFSQLFLLVSNLLGDFNFERSHVGVLGREDLGLLLLVALWLGSACFHFLLQKLFLKL